MIEHTALFYTLAQIAGVFVGFGALIAISAQKGGGTVQIEKQVLTGVVMIGLFTIICALLPILLSAYRMPLSQVWIGSAVLMLVFDWISIWPQLQVLRDAGKRRNLWDVFFWVGLEGAVQIPLILILLPILSTHAFALYATTLIASIFQAAALLMLLVLDLIPDPD